MKYYQNHKGANCTLYEYNCEIRRNGSSNRYTSDIKIESIQFILISGTRRNKKKSTVASRRIKIVNTWPVFGYRLVTDV